MLMLYVCHKTHVQVNNNRAENPAKLNQAKPFCLSRQKLASILVGSKRCPRSTLCDGR